ncbi:hypothetical protein NDU88_003519 [Pleurodeles waltl]|uniref:ribonuclease H n=1 Tax=Pleurodeles waltl TaxID=8319 RepID=A0AAV7Q962_PLEWA|nr:hypothetical protein NDU88_003519 [Pleurodeles waltl]
MPFGLASASAVFQRIMQNLLGDIGNVKFFQDDVLVWAENVEEHNVVVRKVCSVSEEAGLTVEMKKCKFECRSVEYLGHTVSGNGVKPKTNLLEVIEKAPSPSNKDQLRSFLGLAEYYAKFVKNFADVAQPLHHMMKKNVKFEWSKECQQAYSALKLCIINAVELKPFVASDHTIVSTDASMHGLGAVLIQLHKGKERVVAFASRTLKGAEATYSAIEKEALACWWGVKYFRNYVWGRKFELRTDHKPLINVFTTKGACRASSKIAKWEYTLQEYDFTMRYVPGVKNVNADCLSRLPIEGHMDEKEEEWLIASIQDVRMGAINEELWRKSIDEDMELQALKENLGMH